MRLVVLDTSVVVSAMRSALGASHLIMRLVADSKLRPLLTTALLLEYEDVLKRPEQRLVHRMELVEIDAFLAGLASAGQAVDVHIRWRPMLADPADELVLEAALNGHASCIVTHNIRHFENAGQMFGLQIVRPGELLKELRA